MIAQEVLDLFFSGQSHLCDLFITCFHDKTKPKFLDFLANQIVFDNNEKHLNKMTNTDWYILYSREH